ncbi:MAG: hypothetical protein ACOH1X_07115 [Kaistella sp.]
MDNTNITYPEELKTIDYLFADDLKNLLLSISDISQNLRGEKDIEILNRGIDQITSISRTASKMINPYLFDKLETLLEKLKKDN